ncbi:hypothetical protein [Calidifontibacillus erzurumensis]|uniref:Uncharacterized protein n=1 Tax=Calidifontibacillus erzurumensis TaxID=2741433 RepID=A0A8J8GJ62_9BACI|nr:hypothetical protein [Calidifontibacillus erzurumensis]NSL52723.1 hypothetical protein [Calidifontibacillus erzurumensis]
MEKKLSPEEHCKLILEENGPLLGSELNEQLQNKLQVSAVYARKIIQRANAKGIILSTKPVSFRHGQFLYYLKHHNISNILPNFLKQHRKGLNRVFSSLLHNKGEILQDEAYKIAASVTNNNFFPKNETTDKTLRDLKELTIIDNVETYNHISFIKASKRFFGQKEINFGSIRRHMINRIFTLDAIRWLEQTNLLAWNQSQVFNTNQRRVDFNGHLWDVVGFTYLYGHYEAKFESNQLTKIPSFVFIESIFHRQTYLEDIEGFVSRIEMQSARLKNNTTGSRITPILFYSFMDKEAFDYSKTKGLMMINSRGWLGEYAQELFEFLANPTDNDLLTKCDYYLQLLHDRGFYQSHLMYELMKIKYAQHFILQGWKNRRHVHYEFNNELYYFDWLMYDTNNTAYLCLILSKDENINHFINNEFPTFKSVYKYYNNEQEFKWIIFDQDGNILKQKS